MKLINLIFIHNHLKKIKVRMNQIIVLFMAFKGIEIQEEKAKWKEERKKTVNPKKKIVIN